MSKQGLLEEVIKFSEDLLSITDLNTTKYSVIKYVTVHFYIKGIKLAKSILTLSKAGLFVETKILFRPLFEVALYCEYIIIDIKTELACENIMALAALEDIKTDEDIKRYGFIKDVDSLPIKDDHKDFFRRRVPEREAIRLKNYNFIIERLRIRSKSYANLKADEILNKENIRNKGFLEEVNERFNKESNTYNLWKQYKTILRENSKSIHALDFEENIEIKNNKLISKLTNNESAVCEAAATFLIRILDVFNEVFELKVDNKIKEMIEKAQVGAWDWGN